MTAIGQIWQTGFNQLTTTQDNGTTGRRLAAVLKCQAEARRAQLVKRSCEENRPI